MKNWKVFRIKEAWSGYSKTLVKEINQIEKDGWTLFSVLPSDRSYDVTVVAWRIE